MIFYGSLAEAIGREAELSAEAGETVADVRARLIALYPHATEALSRPSVRAYLDDRMVHDGAMVLECAQIAFLPPLSGG